MDKTGNNLRKAMDQIQKMTNRALELRVDTSRLTARIILANNVEYLEEIHQFRQLQLSPRISPKLNETPK